MKNLYIFIALLFLSITQLFAQPVLRIANAQASAGSNVAVDLDVEGFTNVGAISMKIQYDTSVLTYININNSPSGVTFTSNAAGGVITIGWFDASGNTPLDIASGKLLNLNFTFNGGFSHLNFVTGQGEIANDLGVPYADVIYMNGSVSEPGFILLEDNFDIAAGEPLTSHGWAAHSGGVTNAISVVSPGLTFPDYSHSGIGNAASLTTSGQDVNKMFSDSIMSGSIYSSMMVNVSSAQSNGDYIFHYGVNPSNTFEFYARTYVRLAGNGNLSFGIAKSSVSAGNPVSYSDSIFTIGTTYLLVVKYQFNSGEANDVVELFINPAISTTEPSALVSSSTTQNDAASIGTVALRQGNGSNAAGVIVDGIKVSQTWSGVVPVELTSFSATTKGNAVHLNWVTATEVNNSGFDVQKSSDGKSFFSAGFVSGKGTTTEISNYSFADKNISSGAKYYYRLKQIDFDGTFEYSDVIFVDVTSPKSFSLEQNYPNPFNPSTTINFNLPVDAKVVVRIIDAIGNEIHQVIDNNLTAGNHVYNINLSQISSGVYFYNLEATGIDGSKFSSSKKMMLMK